jgi:cob(I)alamin adenosyltransferase
MGRHLEYLYSAENSGRYPLLGSCIRAIGKGWAVLVLASAGDLPTYAALGALLKGETRFAASPLDAAFDPDDWDLILIDGTREPAAIDALRARVAGRAHLMVAAREAYAPTGYDLISRFEEAGGEGGPLWAFTGNGKGKSTSAFGVALTALLENPARPAAIVQWFKERHGGKGTWRIAEHSFPEHLLDAARFDFHPVGAGFYGSPNLDRVQGEHAYAEHRRRAEQGVGLARELLLSGEYSAVVLDEFVDTVVEIAGNIEYPLLALEAVRELLHLGATASDTVVVVTGRRVTPHWSPFIGRSIVVHEVLHPWSSKGLPAVSGLDF